MINIKYYPNLTGLFHQTCILGWEITFPFKHSRTSYSAIVAFVFNSMFYARSEVGKWQITKTVNCLILLAQFGKRHMTFTASEYWVKIFCSAVLLHNLTRCFVRIKKCNFKVISNSKLLGLLLLLCVKLGLCLIKLNESCLIRHCGDRSVNHFKLRPPAITTKLTTDKNL